MFSFVYNRDMGRFLLKSSVIFFLLFFAVLPAWSKASGGLDIAGLQAQAKGMTEGERIAFFADQFLGVPYDTDPLGLYVTRRVIVADDRIDCMYLVFRSAEIALSSTPRGAEQLALYMRFKTKGRLGPDGRVLNYGDRFQYGLDMILSGKWGRNITRFLGKTIPVETSSRFQKMGVDTVMVLPRREIGSAISSSKFRSGDIVFFVKDPAKRAALEVIGHMGILEVENGDVYLIHAHGLKKTSRNPDVKPGAVTKVLFKDYVKAMPFIGIMVTRIQGDRQQAARHKVM